MRLPEAYKDEAAIIGCCLLGGTDTCIEAVESLPVDALCHPTARELFLVIEDMATQGKPVNESMLFEEWRATKDQKWPEQMITEAMDVPSPANLSRHIETVIETWRKRRVIESSHALWTKAQLPNSKVDDLIAEAEVILHAEEVESVQTVDGKEAAQMMIDDLQRRFDLQGKLSGVETGYYKLDKITDGMQFGEQTVIGARPSMGKTALGLCICANAALKNSVPTLFVSIEMSVPAIMRRLLSLWTHIPMGDIRRGSYSAGDFKTFTTFRDFISRSPLKFTNAVKGIGIGQLCATVRRRVRKDKVRLVVVDYLQKIRPAERQEKKTYEIGEVSSSLKALAESTNCAMVTLAQLNRESEKDKKPRPPRLSDLGDSKQIEMDADTVCLIHRDRNDKEGRADIIIAKQRDAETGIVPLIFNGKFCRFENPETISKSDVPDRNNQSNDP